MDGPLPPLPVVSFLVPLSRGVVFQYFVWFPQYAVANLPGF